MVPAIVAITAAIFLFVNLAVELTAKLVRSMRAGVARRRALGAVTACGSNPEFPSLRQVRLGDARSVLAVSRDAARLDRVRRALVVGGYRIDTVETAAEAARLLAAGGYDLLLTDLEQAPMLELAARQTPPVGVVAWGGDSAADSRFAATVAWPLSDRKLRAEIDRALVRHAARLEAASRPQAQLVTVDQAASPSPHVINVPAGLFIAPNHTWLAIQPNGEVCVGLDEFVAKLIASAVDDVDLPLHDDRVGRTVPLFSVHRGTQSLDIESPVEGRVTAVNDALHQDPALLNSDPYTHGWICRLKAENLARDLHHLKLGEQTLQWYTDEIERHLRARKAERAPSRGSLVDSLA